MRQRLLGVGGSGELGRDFLVVAAFLAVCAALATRAYPRAVL